MDAMMSKINSGHTVPSAPQPRGVVVAACLAVVLSFSSGCTTLFSPIAGIPVSQLPPELLGEPKSDHVAVPAVMLSIPPDRDYRLDEGDILGLYIEGVLPFSSPTAVPEPPPVNFPGADSPLPPSIGFPIAIQAGGVLNLPMIEPFSVQGMTLEEARQTIATEYRERDILAKEETTPVVTLIRERTYNVTVIRSNGGPPGATTGVAAGYDLQLPAYRNDVLHALTQTGGLPGFHEKNEITIFKTSRIPEDRRRELLMHLTSDPVGCPPSWLAGDSGGGVGYVEAGEGMIEEPFVVRVPLRVPPGTMPRIDPADIELAEGDIVYVESRETEFFYTGGMLPGAQIPLPRDYDLHALGALALAGSGVASQAGGGGGGGGRGGLISGMGGVSPTQLYVIRKLPCGRTFNISVDLQEAMNDSTQNILVQPGDTLVLRFKPHEEIANFALGTFFTFGIRELFRD